MPKEPKEVDAPFAMHGESVDAVPMRMHRRPDWVPARGPIGRPNDTAAAASAPVADEVVLPAAVAPAAPDIAPQPAVEVTPVALEPVAVVAPPVEPEPVPAVEVVPVTLEAPVETVGLEDLNLATPEDVQPAEVAPAIEAPRGPAPA